MEKKLKLKDQYHMTRTSSNDNPMYKEMTQLELRRLPKVYTEEITEEIIEVKSKKKLKKDDSIKK